MKMTWGEMKRKKTIVVLGSVVGMIASSVGAFAAVQLCWLTPSERDAARTALTAVDGLEGFTSLDGDDADAQTKRAEDAVESARQAARTARDQDVAFALIQYLGSIEMERAALRAQGLAPELVSVPLEDAQPRESTQLTPAPAIRSLGLKLHATLD